MTQEHADTAVPRQSRQEHWPDLLRGANAVRFGLAASIATHNLAVAEGFMEGVEAGLVHVNQPTAGVEYQTPFGGVKDSGYGRELAGQGLREFTNAKTVWVSAPAGAAGGRVE